jgi:branched-subunit amino acid transport protein
VFLIFLIAAIGTYMVRLSGVLLLGGPRALPPRLARSLNLIAPAAMAAIIANSLLLDGTAWRPFGAWHIAAIIAVGVAVWRRSAGVTLLVGAAAFGGLLAFGL